MKATRQQLADRALTLWQNIRTATQQGHLASAATYRTELDAVLKEINP